MVKSHDEAFESAKQAYMLYGLFLQESSKEIGWDKALAIHANVGGRLAGMIGGVFRDECGGANLETGAIEAALHKAYRHAGLDYDVSNLAGTLSTRTYRCPILEGLIASGMELAMIEKACNAMKSREADALHAEFPALSVSLKFRAKPTDACVEEFVLAK